MSAIDNYLRAQQGQMDQFRNMLAFEQSIQKQERDQKLRNILASAYTAPQAALPAEAAAGPVMPNQSLPDYPAQAAVQGGVDNQEAINSMYQGGFGPEAMAMEQKQRQLQGATPSAVNEYKFFDSLPEKDQDKFLAVKRAQQIKKIGGVETAISPVSGTNPLGTLKDETDAKSELKKAEVLGGESAKIGSKAFDKAQKIEQNILNLEKVVKLVDEGAKTGVLMNALPSVRSASIELDNMQKQLGLDVIGSVTFGALSKGELDLALSKALPTTLNGPALTEWTKNKINAQRKLKTYLEDQSIYLSKQGSSAAGWIEQQRSKKAPEAPSGSAPQSALNYLKNNDSPAIRQQFKAKYGYLP